jgi:hypothetical protein
MIVPSWISYRINGSSMTFAVFIMAIVLIVIGSIIVYSYLNQALISRSLKVQDLQSNINSGINILLANSSVCPLNESTVVSLYGNGNDSVELNRLRWGVFEICQVQCQWKDFKLRKSVLTGGYRSAESDQVLYLADQKRPLSVCGTTSITGDCMLPVAGIKKTVIEGIHFRGDDLVIGKTSLSNKLLPELSGYNISLGINYFISNYLFNDNWDVLDFDQFQSDSLINSFVSPPVVLYSSEELNLYDQFLEGHIIILSEKSISIDSSCKLKDIIVCAPSIFINQDFEGNLQCFARDTILVNNNVNLVYPSALILSENDEDELQNTISYLGIRSESIVEGLVLSNTVHIPNRKSPVMSLQSGADVIGQLYCNSFLHIQGTIIGTAYVMSFFLKTPSSIYENHLLDARFNKPGLSNHYVGPDLFEENGNKSVIKCLY